MHSPFHRVDRFQRINRVRIIRIIGVPSGCNTEYHGWTSYTDRSHVCLTNVHRTSSEHVSRHPADIHQQYTEPRKPKISDSASTRSRKFDYSVPDLIPSPNSSSLQVPRRESQSEIYLCGNPYKIQRRFNDDPTAIQRRSSNIQRTSNEHPATVHVISSVFQRRPDSSETF